MIIHVDGMDELNTLVRRIRLCPNRKIQLIVPDENPIFQNSINMQLLAKYASELGKEITIKTNNSSIIELAAINKIITISQEVAATKDENDVHERLSTKPGSEGKGKFGFDKLFVLLVIIASLLGLAYYILPKAIVVVTPEILSFEKSLVFSLSDLDGVELISEKTIISGQTSTTGRKTIGTTAAKGMVTLINQGSNQILVKQGTVLKTENGVKFTTMKDVTVPAVTVQYLGDVPISSTAGMVEVEIQGVELGSKGNVARGTISQVEHYELDVRNVEPITGGEDIILKVATNADIEKAQGMALKDGERKLNALFRELPDAYHLLNDTFVVKTQWTDMTEAGEETGEVYVSGVSTGEVIVVDSYKLSEYVSQLLKVEVPQGFYLDIDSIVLDNLRVMRDDDLQMAIDAWALIHGTIDTISLAQTLAGISLDEFETVIESYPSIAGMYLESGKGETLPKLAKWVKIKVEQPVHY